MMGEEKKIHVEEVDSVETPPRARVSPEFERKRDYLAGFLAEPKPEPAQGGPGGELQERAGSPIVQGIKHAEGDHMIPSQGAVPIIRNGVLEGACGVGGGTSQEDEDVARAAVAKL